MACLLELAFLGLLELVDSIDEEIRLAREGQRCAAVPPPPHHSNNCNETLR